MKCHIYIKTYHYTKDCLWVQIFINDEYTKNEYTIKENKGSSLIIKTSFIITSEIESRVIFARGSKYLILDSGIMKYIFLYKD